MDKVVVGSAVTGTYWLIVIQFSSRILSFAMNLILTRYLDDPATIGISQVQLYLFYTICLTISREQVRRIALRSSSDFIFYLSWFYVLIGIFLILPFVTFLFIRVPHKYHDFERAIYIVAFGIVIELLSEPLFVLFQQKLQYKTRSLIEGISVLIRVSVSVIMYQKGIIGFAYGFFAYSLSTLISYLFVYFFFLSSSSNGYSQKIDWEMIKLSFTITWNQIWKLCLAEAENIVMVAIGVSATDQGIYALVSNLGSLLVRFVFLPIEETSFTLFGRLTNGDENSTTTFCRQNVLPTILHFMTWISFIFLALGTQYTHLLILILYGSNWASNTDAPQVLSVYCVYVAMIAINGILEGYLQAIANPKEILYFNNWLIVCSISFVMFTTMFYEKKDVSPFVLITANSFNVLLRIGYNLVFAKRHGMIRLQSLLPRPLVLISTLLAYLVANQSRQHLYDPDQLKFVILHILSGCLGLLMIAMSILYDDMKTVRNLQRLYGASSTNPSEKQE